MDPTLMPLNIWPATTADSPMGPPSLAFRVVYERAGRTHRPTRSQTPDLIGAGLPRKHHWIVRLWINWLFGLP
jgi:hypothetical protein